MRGYRVAFVLPCHASFAPSVVGAAAIISTLALFGLLASNSLLMVRQIQAEMTASSAIADAKAEIRLHDETVTMSAMMAAATGDKIWADRYNATVPKLDKALADAGRFTTNAVQEQLEQSTGIANKRLIELETTAFGLVAANRLPEALDVLRGESYLTQKQIYATGLKDYGAALDSIKARKATEITERFWRDLAVLGLGLLVILAAWVIPYPDAAVLEGKSRALSRCWRLTATHSNICDLR